MYTLQEIALELVKTHINQGCHITSKLFSPYDDSTGQRGHYIIPYKPYGRIVEHTYVMKRVLSFVNPGDEGKDKAVLCLLNLNESKALSIHDNRIEFEYFTFYFNNNPSTRKLDFEYI